MKKFLCIIVALSMLLAMCISASAADVSIEMRDAGYYAATRQSAPTSGEIVFDACFKDFADYGDRCTSFGIYFYDTSADTPVKCELSSGDVTTLSTYSGYFNASVKGIHPEHFDKVLVAVPYVMVDGEIVTGTPSTFTVNQGGKWLGAEK